MTLLEVAKQALEALETCSEDEWHSDDDFGMMQVYDEAKVTQAITALRAALAEPERKPLTDEEIELACVPLGAAMLSFTEVARAIERAHGIGK